MRTALLQSYRTTAQPDWVVSCMASVHALATQNHWAYQFRGDDIFDLVPQGLLDKFATQKPLLCDIARLAWAKEVFTHQPDIDRVIWLDADVYVFEPKRLNINPADNFALGRQIWIQPHSNGRLKSFRQVHNAVLAFNRHSSVLDFLLESVLTLANRHKGPASPQLLGPKLLTALHNILGFDVIESIGMASPLVLRDLANGGGQALEQLTADSATALGALNLCTSYQGQTVDGVNCTAELFENAITALKNGAMKARR